VSHPEPLHLQAYFDGEVDALRASEIEQHLDGCEDCSALLEELEQTRIALRRNLSYLSAPAELRSRLTRALDRESVSQTPPQSLWDRLSSRARPFWFGAVSGGVSMAAVAVLAFVTWAPRLANPLVDDVVGAHVRSLMSSHPIDVISTDRHTVKPWFAGHTDVSPVVADFETRGYKLIGGRVDYLNHQRAAVVVYEHGPHVINVFSWAESRRALPKRATVDGYHLIFWQSGGIQYCAISDTAAAELRELAGLLQDLGARDVQG
jgi:anti-sigma factor RsiW